MARCFTVLFSLLLLLSGEESSSYKKGLSLLAQGLPELAISEFQKSLTEEDLDSTLVRVRLIDAYLQSQLVSKAESEIKLLPKSFPEKSYWSGLTNLKRGRYEEATSAFKKQLQKTPNSLKAGLNLAISYANTNEIKNGLDVLKPFLTESEKANSLYLHFLLLEEENELFLSQLESIKESYSEVYKAYEGVGYYLNDDYLTALKAYNPELSFYGISNRLIKRFECLTNISAGNTETALKIIDQLIETSLFESELISLYDLYLLAFNADNNSQQLLTSRLSKQAKSEQNLLAGFATFYLANLEKAPARRLSLLEEFVKNFETHPLFARAALQLAQTYYGEKDISALEQLSQQIRKTANHSELNSLILNWIGITQQGNDGAKALKLALKYASSEQAPYIQYNSLLNSINNRTPAQSSSKISADQKASLALQTALSLSSKKPLAALKKLESYLSKYPEHDGRALALETLSMLYFKFGNQESRSEKLLEIYQQYQSLEEQKQSFETLNLMENFMAVDKGNASELKLLPSIEYSEFMLSQAAKLHFKSLQYFDAYRIFNKLQNDAVDTKTKSYYKFYQALSGLRIQTKEYKEKAIILLDELSQAISPVQAEAISLYCDLLLDEGYPDKVISILDSYSDQTFDQKLLLARSLALTHGNKESVKKRTESLFKELMRSTSLQAHQRFSLATELISFYEDTEQLSKAIDVYFEVVNLKPPYTVETDKDWELYYNIGNQAIALLESQQSWRASYAFAQKIAEQGGPQVEQSLNRVNELKLKHMIWE